MFGAVELLCKTLFYSHWLQIILIDNFKTVNRFNLTTGKYPFEGDNIFKLFEKIGEGVFVVPEEVDELLGDLLQGMLQKDPYARFSLPQVQHHG